MKMGTVMRSCLFALIFIACNDFSLSRSETVFLDPNGNLTVCPNEIVTFTCKTWGGALVWVTSGNTEFVYNAATQANSDLGIFRLSVNGVQVNGIMVVNVNSTARTIVGFRLEDDSTTLSCLVGSDFTRKDAVLRVADPPQAPVVAPITQLTQHGINNSSILISWNASNCAVQYVVTINSSDDSVYYNITTSDTNTTVKLSNGVEFCVTVVAVDGIGRRGPDSIPLCHEILPTPSTSIVDVSTSVNQSPYAVSTSLLALEHTDTTETGTLSPTKSPVVMGGVSLVVYIVVPIVVILIAVVLVVIVIAVLLLLRRQLHQQNGSMDTDNQFQSATTSEAVIPITLQVMAGQNAAPTGRECACQVFFRQLPGLNNWKFIFTISPKEHLSAAMNQFNNMRMYGDSHDVQLNPDMTDNVLINISQISDGWKEQTELSVSRTAVEQYNGEGKPPHCEIIVEAAAKDVTPSDLSFTVSFNGLQKPLEISIGGHFEAQNIVECIAQVFYYRFNNTSINWWRAKIAFFPKEVQHMVTKVFQDANICQTSDKLNFSGGTISVVPNDATVSGWTVKNSDEHQKVVTTEMEQYKGDGEPPYCELILQAVSDGSTTPDDLSLTVHLDGVKQLNDTVTLTRVLVTPKGVPRAPAVTSKPTTANTTYVCQVFYHRMGLNHWKTTLALSPKDKVDRVREFYQDANIGPTITDVVFDNFASLCTIKSGTIDTKLSSEKGWNVYSTSGRIKINRSDVEKYTGADWPPYIEIISKPMSEQTTPSADLKQDILLNGVTPSKIIIERASDMTNPDADDASQSSKDSQFEHLEKIL